MAKVKQADLQYQDALDQIAYYREELKKRDSRIHELEQALREANAINETAINEGAGAWTLNSDTQKRIDAALK